MNKLVSDTLFEYKRLLPMMVLLIVSLVTYRINKHDPSSALLLISNLTGFAAFGAAIWPVTYWVRTTLERLDYNGRHHQPVVLDSRERNRP